MVTRLRYSKGYQFLDGNGNPLALGKLYYYGAGTTAAQDTYTDAAGTIPNPNPVILDGSGRLSVDIYLGGIADYKEVLKTASGATVGPWPDDNIPRAAQPDWNANSGLAQILNKPALAAVALSGNYADLDGRPAIPAAPQPFTGDNGSGGTAGLVPAPDAGAAVANKFLKADGTWAIPPGGTGSGATNLSVTPSADSIAIGSSSGSGATIAAATAALAGVLDAARAAKIDGLAAVATSGSYADLANRPALGTAAGKDIPASGNALATQVVFGTDTRLSDSRTPLAHAASHASDGSDPLLLSAAQVSGIPSALSGQTIQNIAQLGVNASADASNKLSVNSDAILFNTATGDQRTKLNKSASANTAGFLFQNNFSGRAEFGLLGDDNFSLKVSPDGAAWKLALSLDKTTGQVTFPNSSGFTGDTGSGGSAGLVPAPAAGAGVAGKFLKADGSWTVPPTGTMTGQQIANALNGTPLESFALRDPTITGFTGAKVEFLEFAFQLTDPNNFSTFAQIPIAIGEIVYLRFNWLFSTTDLSKSSFGSSAKCYRRVNATSTSALSGTTAGDSGKDTGITAFVSLAINTASKIDLIAQSDATGPYNAFVWLAVQRMINNI